MYANVIQAKYRSKADMEQAKAKLTPLLEQVTTFPGFQGFTWLSLGETESMSVAIFATPEQAAAHREKMPPKATELVSQHLEGKPNIRHGPVIATK